MGHRRRTLNRLRKVVCGLSLCLILAALLWWNANPLLPGGAFVALYIAVFLPESLRFRRYRGILRRREFHDYDRECLELAATHALPPAAVTGAWNELAQFYGIPGDRVHASDALSNELSGIVEHPDCDLAFLIHSTSLVLPTTGMGTWGDLVVWLCRQRAAVTHM